MTQKTRVQNYEKLCDKSESSEELFRCLDCTKKHKVFTSLYVSMETWRRKIVILSIYTRVSELISSELQCQNSIDHHWTSIQQCLDFLRPSEIKLSAWGWLVWRLVKSVSGFNAVTVLLIVCVNVLKPLAPPKTAVDVELKERLMKTRMLRSASLSERTLSRQQQPLQDNTALLHRLWEGVLRQMGWNAVDHTTDTSSLSNIGKWDIYGPFNIAGGSNPNGTQSFLATKVVSTCPSLTDGSVFGEELPLLSKTRTLWKLNRSVEAALWFGVV